MTKENFAEITSIKLSISVRPFKPMNKLIGVPQPHLDEGFVMEYWIPQKKIGWTGGRMKGIFGRF